MSNSMPGKSTLSYPLTIGLFFWVLVIGGCGTKSSDNTPAAKLNGNPGTDGPAVAVANKYKPDTGHTAEAARNTKQTTEPRFLDVKVTTGQEDGDLDFYFTNISDETLTNCTVEFFEGAIIEIAVSIKPGETGICGIADNDQNPSQVTFRSDQFEKFTVAIPKQPLKNLDLSQFKIAGMPALPEANTNPQSAQNNRPAAKRDLLDFGEDDITETKPNPDKDKKKESPTDGDG